MSLLRKSMVLMVAVLLPAIVAAPASRAEEERRNPSEQWIPSLTLSVGVHDEGFDLAADQALNSDFSFDRSRSRTMASLRIGGELMTPTFENLPIRPRFFATAGVLWSPPGNAIAEDQHDTVNVEDYRDFDLAASVTAFNRREFTTPGQTDTIDDFEGQGIRATGRQLHNAWFIGVGAAFTFPMSGFSLRVRPSLEYVGEDFTTEGEFTLLTLTGAPAGSPQFKINETHLKDNEIHHNLGPALELEFINHLDGNLTLSFFTQTRFLWVVGDRQSTLRDSLGNARFVTRRNRFNFRGGAGIRLGWRELAFDFN